ncbi:MAG TPA: hypothetical protein VFK05_14675 [Polyangiaceae bacterium]|nr:hypothetical protein [Polyangiaceae bacterium]
MLHPSIKATIDHWIEEAPEFRRVESEPLADDAWEIRALEDDQVVYEDVELDTDEPTLYKLAAWCEKHSKLAPRPPVKAGAPPLPVPASGSARR